MDTLSQLKSGKLAGIRRLDLSCNLMQFPEEIYDLADSIEILNLSGNALTDLPDDLPRLSKLRVIFCSDNRFTHLPDVLGKCQQLEMVGFKANRIKNLSASSLPAALRWLILTDNELEGVPGQLGQCSRLQKLMLAGNRLQHLPDKMAECQQLELLRISANRLEALPDWLFSLPRLSWLAYAGNPFSDAFEKASKLAVRKIGWHELDLQHKLGEGASGVIHKADWQAPEGVMPVAVKFFKGEVTSDGLPRSEEAACLAAGTHPNLISATGKIIGHPENASGLVMPLVDESFASLAGPPSLESCTRDIYSAETGFSLEFALAIARGVVAALEHLHAQGIMHGDVYAHNLLWNKRRDCVLGDFGAASFIPEGRQADKLRRIEVRAFACLLEELLARCTAPVPEVLWELQRSCMQENVEARPLFAEICKSLAQQDCSN